MFKIFMFALLPAILIILAALIIWVGEHVIKCVKPNAKFETRRYITISVICIIFTLHPKLTLSSLRLFQ